MGSLMNKSPKRNFMMLFRMFGLVCVFVVKWELITIYVLLI